MQTGSIGPDPEFVEPLQNLTVTAGRDVKLQCSVKHLGSYKVRISFFVYLRCSVNCLCLTSLRITMGGEKRINKKANLVNGLNESCSLLDNSGSLDLHGAVCYSDCAESRDYAQSPH